MRDKVAPIPGTVAQVLAIYSIVRGPAAAADLAAVRDLSERGGGGPVGAGEDIPHRIQVAGVPHFPPVQPSSSASPCGSFLPTAGRLVAWFSLYVLLLSD
jgi:hypothetical protein